MPNILDSDSFGEKIYNRFPIKYREDDVEHNYALKRFIFVASEGGFKHVIDDANGILNLIDPATAPLEVVKLLYEQFGVPMFNGIPEEFLRSFLPNLGRALDYRGTLSVIDYVATSISGVKINTEAEIDDTDNSVDLTITLDIGGSKLKYFPDYTQFIEIMENFIPFYCLLYVVYNYDYSNDENRFHIYVGHAIKYIEEMTPNGPFIFEDPLKYLNYYVYGDHVLVDEKGNLITSGFVNIWDNFSNRTWGDLVNSTWDSVLHDRSWRENE